MDNLQKSVSLLPYNTLRVDQKASRFSIVQNSEELSDLIKEFKETPTLILGEGANILLTKDFEGLVIKNELSGKKIIAEDNDHVTVEISAGENWHDFVMWTCENGWSGVENMAYIPGTVGAAPVQNIAAYGENFEDVFVSLQAISLGNGNQEKFTKVECKFSYRESVFKKELRGKMFVTSVIMKLSKIPVGDTHYHEIHNTRFSLVEELAKTGKTPPFSPKDIAEVIISMRKVKQPDWHQVGTAGSFFKNPVVTKEKYQELSGKIFELQSYPLDKLSYPRPDDPAFDYDNNVKIPAGRLLDELGWKGKKIGNVATFERQALAVINLGGATGQEILDYSKEMMEDVKKNYGIGLEFELVLV